MRKLFLACFLREDAGMRQVCDLHGCRYMFKGVRDDDELVAFGEHLLAHDAAQDLADLGARHLLDDLQAVR